MDWSEEKIQQLELHYAAGLSCRQIGALLGVSRNAVIGKIHRLNLPKRGPPRVNEAQRELRKVQKAKDAVDRRRLHRRQTKEQTMPLPEPVPLSDVALNIPFADLRDFRNDRPNQCRYIPGEGPQFIACGIETADGASYCKNCLKIVTWQRYEISEESRLKMRAHFIKIGNASKIGRTLDLGDAA